MVHLSINKLYCTSQLVCQPMSIDLVGSRSFEASFSKSESEDIDNPILNNVQGVLHRQNSSHVLEADNRDRDIFRTPVVFEVTIQKYSKLVRLCSTVGVFLHMLLCIF